MADAVNEARRVVDSLLAPAPLPSDHMLVDGHRQLFELPTKEDGVLGVPEVRALNDDMMVRVTTLLPQAPQATVLQVCFLTVRFHQTSYSQLKHHRCWNQEVMTACLISRPAAFLLLLPPPPPPPDVDAVGYAAAMDAAGRRHHATPDSPARAPQVGTDSQPATRPNSKAGELRALQQSGRTRKSHTAHDVL
eukprot:921478-Rhodomonas_salina.3